MTNEALTRAVTEAVTGAIKSMELENFKKTSFFISNHRIQREEMKLAA